jgi:hypothetical protein
MTRRSGAARRWRLCARLASTSACAPHSHLLSPLPTHGLLTRSLLVEDKEQISRARETGVRTALGDTGGQHAQHRPALGCVLCLLPLTAERTPLLSRGHGVAWPGRCCGLRSQLRSRAFAARGASA